MNQIRFVGYDACHLENFIFDVPEGHDCYLLVLTNTPARFWLENTIRECPAHHAILYPPHSKIRYGAWQGPYGNDWLRFSTDESFVINFPLQNVPFPVSDPEYCHNLFQLLTWEQGQKSQDAVIAQLLRILFYKLRDDLHHPDTNPHSHGLLTLRKQILNHPQKEWKIADMAASLHLSAGYLQFLYKQQFGTSCMDDVIQSRLRMAKDFLSHSEQSVSEIARLCGYGNTEHFCRQFRKCNGITPGQFRKNTRNRPLSAPLPFRTVAGTDYTSDGPNQPQIT